MQDTINTTSTRLLPTIALSMQQARLAAAAALALLVLTVCTAFIFSMLYYTRGHLSAPLDDTLIYFQYAKQAAHGSIMRYQDGDPRTTGATGFAYPLILALGYLGGFRGDGLFVFALGFNAIMLLATVTMTFVLARRIMDERAAWLAAAFVAINGWLGWTFLAMMETGVHTVFLLVLLYCYARAREGGVGLAPLLMMLALAPFARPEQGGIAVVVAVAFGIDAMLRRGGGGWQYALAAPAAAVAGICAFFAIVHMTTGTVRTNTFVAQSVWGVPGNPYLNVADRVVSNFFDFVRVAFEWFGPTYVATAAFLLFAYGGASLVAGDVRRREVSVRSLIPVLALLGFASTSILGDVSGQNHRWAAPYEPLVVIAAAYGGWRASQALPEARPLVAPLVAIGLLMSALVTVRTINRYGQNNADIYYQQIVAAEWVRDNTPPNAIVGMNDAGALGYFSRRRLFDLVGLTGPIEHADTNWQGHASVFEAIERMPESERPTMYVIYPEWWPITGLNGPTKRFLTPQTAFSLSRRTIAGGQDEIVYTPDNALLNSGEQTGTLPPAAAGWSVVDSIDVADEVSERDHGYEHGDREVGAGPLQVIALRGSPGLASDVLDGARAISGHETFRLRVADASKPYAVVGRVDATAPAPSETATVSINGAANVVTLPPTSTTEFQNAVIAQGDAGPEHIDMTITARPGSPGYYAYHYWLLQP